MMRRTLAVWLAMVGCAILNGAFRQSVLLRYLGFDAAHILSTAMLCAAILLIAWLTSAWIGAKNLAQAIEIGFVWLTATIAFEALAGHYLFGNSWDSIVADYDVTRGRVWILVLLTTLLSPVMAFAIREPGDYTPKHGIKQ